MKKANFVEHVEGLGDVYVVYDLFDNQVQALKDAGIEVPESVRDASYVRLHGKSQEYTRTCHAPICAKDSPVIIARVSPAIGKPEMLKAMVNAHIVNQYPILDSDKSIYREWLQIAEQDKGLRPEKRRAIILPQRVDYRIHRDSDEAEFFWQDTRKEYFKEKVNGDSIQVWQIPIDVVDSINGTIVNFVGFDWPVDGSGLSFRGRCLGCGGGAFGVLKKTSEAGLQKPLQVFLYTSEHLNVLSEALHKEGIIGDLEKRIVESVKRGQ